MENISIGTAQNVEIDYEIASVGDRMLAQLIDFIITRGYILLYVTIGNTVDSAEEYLLSTSSIILFLVLPVALYHLVLEILTNGQSIGKLIMKLKVVKTDGSQPDIASYLLRWFMGLLEIEFNCGSIALVSMLLNKHGQRLGDMAAGTTVVKLRNDITFDQTIFQNIDTTYQPQFTEAQILTDEDARLMKEVMDTFMSNEADRKKLDVILQNTQEYIKRKYDITSDMPPITFFDVMLKDYNHYHGYTK